MLGKWLPWFLGKRYPEPFGDVRTYEMAAEFLKPCATVEDRGCGLGYFKEHYRPQGTINVDGTYSLFCDEVVDLVEHRRQVDGIMMRHVLEHNTHWRAIFHNALSDFTQRLALIIYTPFTAITTEIARETISEGNDVPVLGFGERCFAQEVIQNHRNVYWTRQTIETDSHYHCETIFRFVKVK